MILTLDDVKTQLRLELDFTEHDAMLTQMVNAAQRSIERDYYCKLVTSDEELQALPETVRGFIADEDISNCLEGKNYGATWWYDSSHSSFFLSIAFRMVSSLRIQATSATFLAFPAASRRT
ncbi:Uncharacterised protein [Klebsiella pneumoniae]|uniref:Phage gp6-like head-tail connector protein n=10 Tax=Klebsiella TaxID=570 RepID=A0A377WIS4_KLEPN|nr:Uncharacterised protein [Klebsiella pneumoniae]